jgi:hypothetical protein
MTKLAAIAAAAIGVLVSVPLLAAAGAAGGAVPTREALDDIPPAYLALYQTAVRDRCPRLPWAVLAAIGKIESDHGRTGGARLGPDGRVEPRIIGVALDGSPGTRQVGDTDDGLYDGDGIFDRAVGPMQFIPSTWARAGVDASGDGLADPHNAIDAVHAAASYLCSVGADDPSRIRDAVWAYNHSWEYVDAVLIQASRYAVDGGERVRPSPTLIAMVLANPRLDIYADGRRDIASGLIDARILTILQLASERHTLTVSSLKTGHSRCVGGRDYAGCRVSHHWHGRAVDISAVDGGPVSESNAAARTLAGWLAALPTSIRPTEVGSPWSEFSRFEGFFADRDHADHIHLALGPVKAHLGDHR